MFCALEASNQCACACGCIVVLNTRFRSVTTLCPPFGAYVLPVDLIRFEFLPADTSSMAMSTIQAAYIVRKYITGGYVAEYQFKIIYRVKPGNSNDKRLKADELLNAIGDWANGQKPDIGDDKRVISMEPTTRSSLFAMYENGDEDHQILMKLNYEVNV